MQKIYIVIKKFSVLWQQQVKVWSKLDLKFRHNFLDLPYVAPYYIADIYSGIIYTHTLNIEMLW